MRTRVLPILRVVAFALLLVRPASADQPQPFFFIQLTDPQFGMYAQNANFEQETANFEFAIATANRLKPAFVIVTGDLVNKAGDAAQVSEYLRVCAKLDRSIRLYHVPGNHDLSDGPESLAAYEARFGPDHYSFRHGNLAGIVLNSNLVCSKKADRAAAERQEVWLKAELDKARKENVRHVVIFQHCSLFLKSADEPDQYFTVPRQQRRRYLDLLRDHGVTHVFAGHYHGNQIAREGTLEMVTSGPIGKPLRKEPSGMRVVIVRDTGIEHRYYTMGDTPNQIDLAPPNKR